MPRRGLPSLLLSLALSGCTAKYTLSDVDGDGYTAFQGDCWDSLSGPEGSDLSGADIHPGADETFYDGIDQDCAGDVDDDQDGDGYALADDCDDAEAATHPGAEDAWYDGVDSDCAGDDDYDQDQDSYASDDDCDDTDAAVHPGAQDAWYDGVDADCAGNDDDDQDGDGYPLEEDCDDEDPTRYPDAPVDEIWYNGVDENCDGNDGDKDGDGYVTEAYTLSVPDWEDFPDHLAAGDCWDDPDEQPPGYDPLNGFEELSAEEVSPDAEERYYDGIDQDCFPEDDFDQDGDSFESAAYENAIGVLGDDCDDEDAAVYPGADDTWYDGVDSNCVGDDDFDADVDSYVLGDDCDDGDAEVHPGATDACDELGVDEDCDGDTNELDAPGCSAWYVDTDGDGLGADPAACYCEATASYSASTATDCDDTDAEVLETRTWYDDADGDAWGDATEITKSCEQPTGTVAVSGDCDEGDADINPGANEICDRVSTDEDCDGLADDEDDSTLVATMSSSYTDADADGYGATETLSCDLPVGSVRVDGDCDDSSGAVFPGATEVVANGTDEDCDGGEICYLDADADGFRVDSTVTSDDTDCTDTGEGESAGAAGDCDDADGSVYPGATEVAGDEVDQDCDGRELCYADADDDGYAGESTVNSADSDCVDRGEAADDGGDCDDTDPDIYPGAVERCDAVDDDCDGQVLDVDQDNDGSPDFSKKVLAMSRSDGDLLQIADSDALDFGTGSWTVEAWVHASDFDAGSGSVRLLDRSYGTSSDEPYWALDLDSLSGYGFPGLDMAGDAGGSLADGTVASDDGFAASTWLHLAMVVDVDANTTTWYFDGQSGGSEDLPSEFYGSKVDNSAALTVSSLTAPFDGMIDELRIWGLARTAAQIQDGRCRPISDADPAFPDLLLYLPLEDSWADKGPYGLSVSESGSPGLIDEP